MHSRLIIFFTKIDYRWMYTTPFSIVLNRFWYFIQDLLRTIEPLENNKKWVWYVYKQHNNLVVGLVFEIQDLALRARSWISIQDLPLGYYPIFIVLLNYSNTILFPIQVYSFKHAQRFLITRLKFLWNKLSVSNGSCKLLIFSTNNLPY